MDSEHSFKRWNIPDLGEAVDPKAHPGPGRQDKGGENNKSANEEGFECGRREGLESGRQAVAAQVQHLEQLMQSLAQPFEELDHEVEAGLVALTLAIVRKLLHVEIKTSPEMIAEVVHETLALLPSASRDISLHLHPEDAQLLNELQPGVALENKWKIVSDASLARGGCLVRTRASQVDASVEARLENVMTALLNVDLERA